MTGISITILGEDNMSHNSSKKQWDALTTKEKELIWLKHHNTRILPSSISGSELDKIFKNEKESEKESFEKYFSSGPSLGGIVED